MQKWTNQNAGPIQCNRFNKAWNHLHFERNTYICLSGVTGVKEYRFVQSTLGGSDPRKDVLEAMERIGEKFAWTVTAQNVNDILKAIEAETTAAEANRPVKDERRTPESVAEQNAKLREAMDAQKAKSEESARAFIAHYGNGEKVTIQPGQMVVVAQICYDNSDSMTDYFDRHASLSQSFALLVVPKQAETERLARRGVAVSPLFADVAFEWHTEKYSMGHGNYLESKTGFELPAELQGLRNRYGSGSGVTHAHWEITFTRAYSQPVTLDAIAGYGQHTPDPHEPDRAPVSDLTITENDEKNGIEIRFPSKPAAAILDTLKAAGWRWSRFSGCWYTKRTDAARQFAESLKGSKEQTTSPTKETGAPVPVSSSAPVSQIASRFRMWADALQPKIDHAGRPMTQNPTPKRNREYQSRMHDCRNMERTQKALRALADAHGAGTMPADLAGLKTRDEIGAMVRKYIDGSKGGYYSCIESDDYADKSPAARTLQAMIEGNHEERTERERLRKIEALKAEIALSSIPGYFPTQSSIASYMVDLAEIEDGMTVLEPEAGSGHIADTIRERIPDAQIDCCELNPRLRALLTLKGYNLVADDFLDLESSQRYDRIVMNPPFEKQADIDHVRKAHQLLAPKGLLVSVVAPGFEFRSDRKSTDFRDWLNDMGARVEDLPAESFKASGTNVSTKLVIVPATATAPEQPAQSQKETVLQ